jgi:16S rRNA (guanine527-N7)-methyltransferase
VVGAAITCPYMFEDPIRGTLSRKQIGAMIRLDELVVEWGSAIRLTGFSTEKERVERYFEEALFACSALPDRGAAVDMGSGGGTPALPLAIVRPEVQWVMLEPNKKKAIFLEEAVRSLRLSNVEVIRERYGGFTPGQSMDLVTTRGLSVNKKLLACAWGWLNPGGYFFSWTGKRLTEEIIGRCGSGWSVESKEPIPPRKEAWLLVLRRVDVE